MDLDNLNISAPAQIWFLGNKSHFGTDNITEVMISGPYNHLLGMKNLMIMYSKNKNQNIDWDEAVIVFERAPLGKRRREPEKLKRAFESSYAVVYVFDSDKLIGMGRALCDGEYQAAIYDMVVLPECQGKGIGKEIIERLCEQLPVENIILYAVPGREGFYEKCGFKKMRTAMAKLNPLMSDPDSGYIE